MKNVTKYFSFTGKTARQEYWVVNLISTALNLMVLLLWVLLQESTIEQQAQYVGVVISVMLGGGICWLWVATATRRIGDSGHNIWWLVAYGVPVLSLIVWVYFGCVKSESDEK